MNRWRKIRDTDDGCTTYECLKCKTGWESRTTPEGWSFCPKCGVNWEGELVWDQDAHYERAAELYQRSKRVRVFPDWVLEERFHCPLWDGDDIPEWEKRMDLKNCSAKAAFATLKQFREIYCRPDHDERKPHRLRTTHEMRVVPCVTTSA